MLGSAARHPSRTPPTTPRGRILQRSPSLVEGGRITPWKKSPLMLARTTFLIALVTSLALLFVGGRAHAQCGTWTDQHTTGVIGDGIYAWAYFDDGAGPELYAAGNFTMASGVPASGLVRWNGSAFEALAAQPNSGVRALRVWDDGTGPALYAGGSFTSIGATTAHRLAKYRGGIWSQVGSGIDNGGVSVFDVFDDGSGPALYVGGQFTSIGGQYQPGLTRWNGSAFTFVPGVQGGFGVSALAHYDDGSGPALYAGGEFTAAGGVLAHSIARWNGITWSAVGSMPVQTTLIVSALTVHAASSGTVLVAGGVFQPVSGNPSRNVAAWNGTAWSTLGDGLDDPLTYSPDVFALASIDMGDGQGPSLYAGGQFTRMGTVPIGAFVRWNGSTWGNAGMGIPVPAVRSLLPVVDSSGPRLLVGGSFPRVGSTGADLGAGAGGAAVLAGGTLSALEPGSVLAGPSVRSLVYFDDGSGPALYVSAFFQGQTTFFDEHICRFDGVNWSVLIGCTLNSRAMAPFDDGTGAKLHALCSGLPPVVMSRWNGVTWEAVSSGTGTQVTTPYPEVMVEFDDGSGPALYLGGQFTTSDQGVRSVMRWKNGTWTTVGTMTGYVKCLVVHDDGTGPALYAGGYMTPSAIVKWSGTSWSPLGTGIDAPNAQVLALASFDDGDGPALFVGGSFPSAGGVPAQNIARWKGGAWSALPGGVAYNHVVTTMTVHDDGRGNGPALIVGGRTDSPGLPSTTTLESFDGTSWTALRTFSYPGYYAEVTALTTSSGGASRDLFVGGAFRTGPTYVGLARLSGCGETGETICFGDGSATACPCGNASNPGDRSGCLNSLGAAGTLRARGEPSLAQDTLVLEGSHMPDAPVLYYQGLGVSFGGLGVVSGDGVRCAAGPFVRLGTQINAAGASNFPTSGQASISVRGSVVNSGSRVYQAWYRDTAPSFCTADFHNVTNAVRIVWHP